MTNPTPREIQLVEAALEAALLKMLELSRNGIPCKPSWNNLYGTKKATTTDFMAAIRSLDPAAIVASVVLSDSSLQEVLQPSDPQCGCCGGTGWVVRDPDIGTDQECFACDGTGMVEDEQPEDIYRLEWDMFKPWVEKHYQHEEFTANDMEIAWQSWQARAALAQVFKDD